MEAPMSRDQLKGRIQVMLKGVNLDLVTGKSIRNKLEDELKVDLTEQKKVINQICEEIVNQGSDSSSDDEIVDRKEVKRKSSPKEEMTVKKVKKEKEENGSSSESEVDDEVLARKLQDQDRRTTRRGGTVASKKKSDKKGKKEGAKSGEAKSNAFTRPFVLSDTLAQFTGEQEMPRHGVVKKVWAYVKENELQDPKNKQFAICDESLLKVVGVKRFRMFGMMKLLTKHFIKPVAT